MRSYEGLFLVDDGRASENPQAVMDHIRGLLERSGCAVQSLVKWDSRRLAYEIQGKRRGAYFLAKFQADPTRIAGLERDCRISTVLLRAMIVRQEKVGSVLEASDDAASARHGAHQPDAEPDVPGEESEVANVPSVDDELDEDAPEA